MILYGLVDSLVDASFQEMCYISTSEEVMLGNGGFIYKGSEDEKPKVWACLDQGDQQITLISFQLKTEIEQTFETLMILLHLNVG